MKINRLSSTKTTFLAVLIMSGSMLFSQDHWSITNVAGNGTPLYISGDDALDNGFPSPSPVATDSEGNIYFGASSGVVSNSGVYKVNPDTDEIELVVPGVRSVSGVAVDNAGNIYFSKGSSAFGEDDGYSWDFIYYKKASDGTIDTLAGLLDSGVGVDGIPTNGADARSTPIGNAGGLKIDPSGEYLYYSATLEDNNFIQRIHLTDKTTHRVAGIAHTLDPLFYTDVEDETDAEEAYLHLSLGLGWDSAGNLYFNSGADADDGTEIDGAYSIKKIVDGKIYHVAGNGDSDYTGDNGNAADAGILSTNNGFVIINDELILCSALHYVMRKIVLSTDASADGIITRVCGTGYNENDTDNPDGDLSNGIFKLALESNIRPVDAVVTDEGIYFTDGNLRLRRVADCTNPEIASTAIDKSDICKGDTVTLSFDGSLNDGLKWEWYKDECFVEPSLGNGTSLEVVADETVSYYVVGQGGCTNLTAAECTEIVLDVSCKEYFNTFTPNDDGKNEFLEIPVLENFPENTVIIYNRWGDILEQIENYDNVTAVWRGTKGGTDFVDSGTYYFTAESGGELITSGWIELIK